MTRRRKGGKELEKEAPKLTKKTAGSPVDNAAKQRTQDSAALKSSSTCS